jgi:hypothetical protein
MTSTQYNFPTSHGNRGTCSSRKTGPERDELRYMADAVGAGHGIGEFGKYTRLIALIVNYSSILLSK